MKKLKRAKMRYPNLNTVMMVESFLKNGCQKIESLSPETVDRSGLSVTDPCMGWDETEKLIREITKGNA